MRIGTPASVAARAMCLILSSNFLMLPGLTRTAAQPASMAAKTYRGWKWIGVVLGGDRDPHDVASGRGELGDLLQGGVDVGGAGGGHGLDRDGRVTADGHTADHNLAGYPARQGWRALRGGHA
jgi:hypothetical protein